MYERTLYAGWGDMDFNSHMRNTAFLDKSADLRMMFFADHGFPMAEFLRLKIGPVILRDEVDYYKEIALLQEVRVTISLAGLSEDGSRFKIRNDFFRPDGKLCASVTSSGGWLDLSLRKLVAPPEALLQALRTLHREETFEDLPSSVR